jgi:CBS domain-containing protein
MFARDVMRRRVVTAPRPAGPASELAAGALVAEAMATRAVVCRPDAELAEVAEIMLAYEVRNVPVVDSGDVLGVITDRDLLRSMLRTDAVVRAELQDHLDEYAGSPGRWRVTVEHGVPAVYGDFDDVERQVVTALARTVAGTDQVWLRPAASRAASG